MFGAEQGTELRQSSELLYRAFLALEFSQTGSYFVIDSSREAISLLQLIQSYISSGKTKEQFLVGRRTWYITITKSPDNDRQYSIKLDPQSAGKSKPTPVKIKPLNQYSVAEIFQLLGLHTLVFNKTSETEGHFNIQVDSDARDNITLNGADAKRLQRQHLDIFYQIIQHLGRGNRAQSMLAATEDENDRLRLQALWLLILRYTKANAIVALPAELVARFVESVQQFLPAELALQAESITTITVDSDASSSAVQALQSFKKSSGLVDSVGVELESANTATCVVADHEVLFSKHYQDLFAVDPASTVLLYQSGGASMSERRYQRLKAFWQKHSSFFLADESTENQFKHLAKPISISRAQRRQKSQKAQLRDIGKRVAEEINTWIEVNSTANGELDSEALEKRVYELIYTCLRDLNRDNQYQINVSRKQLATVLVEVHKQLRLKQVTLQYLQPMSFVASAMRTLFYSATLSLYLTMNLFSWLKLRQALSVKTKRKKGGKNEEGETSPLVASVVNAKVIYRKIILGSSYQQLLQNAMVWREMMSFYNSRMAVIKEPFSTGLPPMQCYLDYAALRHVNNNITANFIPALLRLVKTEQEFLVTTRLNAVEDWYAFFSRHKDLFYQLASTINPTEYRQAAFDLLSKVPGLAILTLDDLLMSSAGKTVLPKKQVEEIFFEDDFVDNIGLFFNPEAEAILEVIMTSNTKKDVFVSNYLAFYRRQGNCVPSMSEFINFIEQELTANSGAIERISTIYSMWKNFQAALLAVNEHCAGDSSTDVRVVENALAKQFKEKLMPVIKFWIEGGETRDLVRMFTEKVEGYTDWVDFFKRHAAEIQRLQLSTRDLRNFDADSKVALKALFIKMLIDITGCSEADVSRQVFDYLEELQKTEEELLQQEIIGAATVSTTLDNTLGAAGQELQLFEQQLLRESGCKYNEALLPATSSSTNYINRTTVDSFIESQLLPLIQQAQFRKIINYITERVADEQLTFLLQKLGYESTVATNLAKEIKEFVTLLNAKNYVRLCVQFVSPANSDNLNLNTLKLREILDAITKLYDEMLACQHHFHAKPFAALGADDFPGTQESKVVVAIGGDAAVSSVKAATGVSSARFSSVGNYLQQSLRTAAAFNAAYYARRTRKQRNASHIAHLRLVNDHMVLPLAWTVNRRHTMRTIQRARAIASAMTAALRSLGHSVSAVASKVVPSSNKAATLEPQILAPLAQRCEASAYTHASVMATLSPFSRRDVAQNDCQKDIVAGRFNALNDVNRCREYLHAEKARWDAEFETYNGMLWGNGIRSATVNRFDRLSILNDDSRHVQRLKETFNRVQDIRRLLTNSQFSYADRVAAYHKLLDSEKTHALLSQHHTRLPISANRHFWRTSANCRLRDARAQSQTSPLHLAPRHYGLAH